MQYEFNKENFDKLMHEYVKLNLKTQRDKIIEEIKYLIAYETKLCMMNGVNFEVIYNKEISDLQGRNVSEKDFLEAVYAYIYILKSVHNEVITSLSQKIMELYMNE